MKNYKAIAEKQKELIELWSFYADEISTEDFRKIKKLESELSLLESQEVDEETKKGCFNPECSKCEHQNSDNCNTCDILNPQFR